MLSKEAINDFLKDWYTMEEVDKINKSLECIEKGDVIPFEDVIKEFYPNNKLKKEKICIR